MTGENGVSHLFLKRGDKENCGSYQPVSLTSVPGKITVQSLLEDTSEHMQDREVDLKTAGTSWSFSKGKLCLIDLVTLDDGVTVLADKG